MVQQLTPVEGNPFTVEKPLVAAQPKLTAVKGNPFEQIQQPTQQIKPIQRPQDINQALTGANVNVPQEGVVGQGGVGVSEFKRAGKSISKAISKIPESGFQALKDIGGLIRHPVKSVTEAARIAAGGVEKLVSTELKKFTESLNLDKFPEFKGASEDKFDAFTEFMKKRLGSAEALKQTFENDPVGLLLDAQTFLGGVGGLATKAGKLAKLPALAKVGKGISKVAAPVKTLIGARQPINSLVKTALALPKKTGLKKIDQLAEAFLKQGLNITRKAVAKLDTNIKKVQKEINNIIDVKTKEGIKIKTTDITKSLDDLIENAAKEGLELPDIAVIKKMRKQFAEQHGAILTPKQVQDIKIGFNKGFKADLSQRFGAVRQKVRNTLRDVSKTKLEDLNNSLKKLNAKEGVMLELDRAIQDAVITFEKRPTIAVKGLVAGGIASGVGAATTDIGTGLKFGAAAIIAEKIISNPKVQVALAKALRKAKAVSEKTGGVATGGFQVGRAKRIADEKKVEVKVIRESTGEEITIKVSPEEAKKLAAEEKKESK